MKEASVCIFALYDNVSHPTDTGKQFLFSEVNYKFALPSLRIIKATLTFLPTLPW